MSGSSGARQRLLASGCALVLMLPLVLPARGLPQNPPAQNPPAGQQPVFRGATDVVRIDVYPRQDGRIVKGMTREEFQVQEDGASQTIEAFEFVPNVVDGDPLEPRTPGEARRMATDPRNRLFVFYLDTYFVTFEGSARSREPLLEFLRDGFGPRDLFAVMTPKQEPQSLEFVRAPEIADRYLTPSKPWGVMDVVEDPMEIAVDACDTTPRPAGRPGPLLQLWRWVQVMSDLQGLIAHLGATRPERKNLVVVSERWQWPGSMSTVRGPRTCRLGVASAARFDIGGGQRGRGSFELPKPAADQAEQCHRVRQEVALLDCEDRRRDLVTLARRSNVALYFISPAPQMEARFTSLNLAKEMADRTDGLAPLNNDLRSVLARVVDHQTGYYMLGYRSTHGPAGRRPRQVRVRTTRRGVELNVEREYLPPTDEDLARSAAPPKTRVRTEVEIALESLDRIRDETELFLRAFVSGGALELTVELSMQALRSRWREGGDISVVMRDSAGAEIGRADVQLAAGARSAHVQIPMAVAASSLRTQVQLRRGSSTAGEALAVDGAEGAALGPVAIFRAGSLPRLPFLPAADPQFERVERLRLEWPIAGALTNPTVRALNGRGEERPADIMISEVDEGSRKLRADVRLLSLAPGDYVFEAAARVHGQAAKQLVAVRIIR